MIEEHEETRVHVPNVHSVRSKRKEFVRCTRLHSPKPFFWGYLEIRNRSEQFDHRYLPHTCIMVHICGAARDLRRDVIGD